MTPPSELSFRVDATAPNGAARVGALTTPHGVVRTPAFMPVGTAGTVKGLTPEQIAATGSEIILANTYHLHLRPGADVVAELGGLHRFTGWPGPILTDSGGYQVFSLAEITEIDDAGVTFRSHIDGAPVRLDPAAAIAIQNQLGADVIMVLDECPPAKAPRAAIEAAVERTVRWAKACREAHRQSNQQLFGIVQGGLHEDLRLRCAERLLDIGFDGYAVGGLSVGESHDEMIAILRRVIPTLPEDRPRYLMGVGMPADLVAAVEAGIDLFDCVLPTRNGRNAYAFTATGELRLRNQVHRLSDEPLEVGCGCYACSRFSRGYIRHLFIAGEMLGPILASIHNLFFYQRLMGRLRELIPSGRLARIREEFPVTAASEPRP